MASHAATHALRVALLRRTIHNAGLTKARLACTIITPRTRSPRVSSGFDDCAVLTIDGVGDGLSATVSTCTAAGWSASPDAGPHSPGISSARHESAEHARARRRRQGDGACRLRLAGPGLRQSLLKLIAVSDLRFTTVARARVMSTLRQVCGATRTNSSRMAQRALEVACVRMAQDVVHRTGMDKLAPGRGGIERQITGTFVSA